MDLRHGEGPNVGPPEIRCSIEVRGLGSFGSPLNAPVGVVEFLSTGRSEEGWYLHIGLAEPCKYQVGGYPEEIDMASAGITNTAP